jgi:hypothetical protein
LPTITAFGASRTTITLGESTAFTGLFTGGTGVLNGPFLNTPISSGVALSVTPSAITTGVYVLKVTNLAGDFVQDTETVTTVAAPTISSFTATPNAISFSGSTTLSASFTGGTGVVSPIGLPITSGNPVSVPVNASTTYVLTVTNAAGRTITATASVAVTCIHATGFPGETYSDCSNPLGTPGNPLTYNETMALEAATAAAHLGGSTSAGLSCSTGLAVQRTGPGGAATWMYTGPSAGHMFAGLLCPLSSDPTWN